MCRGGLSYMRHTHSGSLSPYTRPRCFHVRLQVPLRQMVLLDVLLIGSGPQALTLASLLTNQEPGHSDLGHDPSPSPSCPSNRRRYSDRKKKKKKEKETTTVSAAAAAVEQKPTALPPLTLRVVDSYGEWAALWRSQFTALNIPHLRSHTLVHTDPLNKKALQDFVLRCDRSAELHSLPDQIYILDENAFFNDMRLGKKEKKRLNVTSTLKKSLSFSLPGTRLSVDFFRDQVQRYDLDKLLIKGTVEKIVPVTEQQEEEEVQEGDDENDSVKQWETEGEVRTSNESRGDEKRKEKKKRVKYFEVHLQQDGVVLKARRVVVATGPTRAQMANVPSWVRSIGESFPEERLQHTVQLMHHLTRSQQEVRDTETSPGPELCVVSEPGQRVMVVGGGLTSAHVVSIALQQGASHVTWVMRKHLQLKQFDVGDVESLVGRYSHVEHGIKMDGRAYLRQFYNERSLHKRLAMIRQARKGGAVTPEAYIHLQPFILNGQVDVRTYCQVSEASWCYRNQAWSLSLSTGGLWTGDRIWLATGCKLDVTQDPLLSELMEEFPIQVLDGWPCISESLQWTDGCPLYLMGQYTALQVGPHAVNLAGGQAASMRIYKDLVQQLHQDGAAAADRSRTEEYVEEMRGLLWL